MSYKKYADVEKTFGREFVFVNIAERFEYVDGQKTDKVIGSTVSVVSPVTGETIRIKLSGMVKDYEKYKVGDRVIFFDAVGYYYYDFRAKEIKCSLEAESMNVPLVKGL